MATAFANFRADVEAKRQLEVVEDPDLPHLKAYWTKTAGLYPSYEDMDYFLFRHDWGAGAEYGLKQHTLMKQVFESRCSEQDMLAAAEMIGANGNVQAMYGCFMAFSHGMGIAYKKSGWENGTSASKAIAAVRKTIAKTWDGVNGFYMSWSEA